jgi:DNA-directed RNA polymerase subunit RPC12/RpoP
VTSTRSKEIECGQCGRRFRVEAESRDELPSTIPCPNCSNDIAVDPRDSEHFWVSRSHADIFSRPPSDDEPFESSHSGPLDESYDGGESGLARRDEDRAYDSESSSRRESKSHDTEDEHPAPQPRESDSVPRHPLSARPPSAPPNDSPASGTADPGLREDSSHTDTSNWPVIERSVETSEELEFPSESLEQRDGSTSTYEEVETQQVASAPRDLEELDAEADRDGAKDDEDDEMSLDFESARESAEADRTVDASIEFEEDSFVEDLDDVAERAMAASSEFEPVDGDRSRSEAASDWGGSADPMEISEVADRFDQIEPVESSPSLDLSPSSDTDGRDDRSESPASDGDEVGLDPESSHVGEPPESEAFWDDETEPPSEDAGEAEADEPTTDDTPRARERTEAGQFETLDLDDGEPDESTRSRASSSFRPRRIGAVGLAVVGVVSIAAGLVWQRPEPTVEPTAPSPAASARETAATLASPVIERAKVRAETVRSRFDAAISSAGESVDEATRLEPVARRLLEREQYTGARRVAIAGLVRDRRSNPPSRETFAAAIERDGDLRPELVTIGREVDVDALHALRGGRSIGFRVTRGGESLYSFKPAQTNWSWRVEVAADVLCKIVVCHFEVPRNRPARISRSTFDALYRPSEETGEGDYHERFDRLEWTEDKGPDGETREYLYGTLEDWVPGFVRWPIEYTEVWEPWLDPESDPAVLEQTFEEALYGFEGRGNRSFYEKLLVERGEATTRSMARQLSSMLTLDFLVLNWDRFSEQYPGVNTQFRDGRFVSIDNGAAFPPRDYKLPRVQRHLSRVGRFSRSTIASIRALEPEVVEPVLFPDPSERDRKRLEVFWRQRRRLLERVDMLLSQYGPEVVYTFE